jgi:Uma2 family endonuclease
MERTGTAPGAAETEHRGGGSLTVMPTLVLDPQPAWIERLLEERRRSGADRRDEVWEGVLHVIPPPSVEHERLAHALHVLLDPYASAVELVITGTVGIGTEDDYRVPDLALLRPGYAPQWNLTAALIVEIVSPRDDTWEKLPFYSAHQVDEVMVVDPHERRVHWLGLEADGQYRPLERSRLLDVISTELTAQLEWS